MPAISLTSVVFPAPLAPISATCSAGEGVDVAGGHRAVDDDAD
jgi:hypothetical protein